MRKSLLSIAALLFTAGSVPASADVINLKYTTFGGNTQTINDGPLTPDMGTAVVNGNSATLTSNNDQVGAVWMDTNGLNSHANFVSLKFDLNILSQAASGYGQAFNGAGTLGGVRIVQNGIFAESLQFMPTDTTSGTFAFRNFDGSAVQTIGNYTTNTLYHIQLDADYTSGTANAYINGILANTVPYPLRAGTGPGGLTSEIFVYLNGASGQGVHNSFTIGDTAQTPLPSTASAGILCLGVLGLGRVVRRRGTAATA